MKKKMLLLLFLMLFPLIIYAEPAYIFLGKSSTESYIVKQGDVITMYLLSNYGPNDDGLLESYNVQLYYNPYVFELVKTENEYIKLPEGWQVTNYKTYSSLINLSVKNNTLENTKEKLEEDEYSGIIAKLSFRVKDNAVNQKTYIELLKDNTNYVEKVNDEKNTFNNSINRFLYYEINSNGGNKLDSHLTSIEVRGSSNDYDTYLTPSFAPGIYEYNLTTTSDSIYIHGTCMIKGCDVEGNTGYLELKKDKTTVKLVSTASDGTKQTYKINITKTKSYDGYPELKSLKVLKYNMIEEFSPDLSTYHVVIPSIENSLLIDYESDFDVTIKGNENLKIGENIVSIEVKNNSGETYTYYLIVSKTEKEEDKDVPVVEEPKKDDKPTTETNKDNKKLYLIICLIISICAIICITILILRDIKSQKEINEQEDK